MNHFATGLRKIYQWIESRNPAAGALVWRFYHHGTFAIPAKRRIRGKGNSIVADYAMLFGVDFDIDGDFNEINISEGCVLNNVRFRVRGSNHKVIIGKSCRFSRGGEIWIEDHGCLLTIGAGTTFEAVHLALTEPDSQIIVGRDCMFAYDIDVRTGDSHSLISVRDNKRINHAQNIIIGDHVWVAAHCILLKGTEIAENSVVATGAVVTKSYKTKGIIIGGNPAAQIKEGITWVRERINEDRT